MPIGTYRYNSQGLRVQKLTAEGTARYVYDDQSVLTRSDADGVTKFEYGPDRLLSVDDPVEGRAFYLVDALGSVVNLMTPQSTVLGRYQWDAWGNLRASLETEANPFGFTGHEHDGESGLIYAKARFYDPEIGRFLSHDPMGGAVNNPPSLHRYLYAYANPTVYIDPTGRIAILKKASEFLGDLSEGLINAAGTLDDRNTGDTSLFDKSEQLKTAGILGGTAGVVNTVKRGVDLLNLSVNLNLLDMELRGTNTLPEKYTQEATAELVEQADELYQTYQEVKTAAAVVWENPKEAGCAVLLALGDKTREKIEQIWNLETGLAAEVSAVATEAGIELAFGTKGVAGGTRLLRQGPKVLKEGLDAVKDAAVRRLRRQKFPRGTTGFAPGEGVSALTANRLQHGTRHLSEADVLQPWRGSTSPQLIRDTLGPVLERPIATFDHVLRGGAPVRGFLGEVNGQQVVLFVYKQGPYQGQLATSVVPSASQLSKWGIP